MLSPPTVWRFSAAADIDSSVFDFSFLNWSLSRLLCRVVSDSRTDTTQQSGQTPVKKVEIKNITVYVSFYTETNTTGMLFPPTLWRFSVAADIVMF
jgi:hypothetical protein